MVLHVLFLEKENGNVPYHLPEKRVVPVEKQMKRSICSDTCKLGQIIVNRGTGYETLELSKARTMLLQSMLN